MTVSETHIQTPTVHHVTYLRNQSCQPLRLCVSKTRCIKTEARCSYMFRYVSPYRKFERWRRHVLILVPKLHREKWCTSIYYQSLFSLKYWLHRTYSGAWCWSIYGEFKPTCWSTGTLSVDCPNKSVLDKISLPSSPMIHVKRWHDILHGLM